MNLETKFDLNQSVCGISHSEFRHIVKCEACACTGKISINGEEFVCPKCSGRATHPRWAGQKWYVSSFNTTIGQIRVVRTTPQHYDSDSHNVNEYMVEDTGVCSGQVWREENLFASKEEAQTECDRRNGALPTEDASELTQPALI